MTNSEKVIPIRPAEEAADNPMQVALRAVFADSRDMSISITLHGLDETAHNRQLDHARKLINRQGALSDIPLLEAEIEKIHKTLANYERDLAEADTKRNAEIETLVKRLLEASEEQGKVYDACRRDFEERRAARGDRDTREFDPEAPAVRAKVEAPTKKMAEIQDVLDKARAEQAQAHADKVKNMAHFGDSLEKLNEKLSHAKALIGEGA